MDALALELADLKLADFDLGLTGFGDVELGNLLTAGAIVDDPAGEWAGMPEFISEDTGALRHVVVHFADETAVEDFLRLLGATLSKKAKFMWFPEKARAVFRDKEYAEG